MEFPQRIQTAARKENIPPALSCYVTPREQRNIQNGVNVNLFPASGGHIRVRWPRSASSIRGSNHAGENIPRRFGRTSGLFQTNLLCPSRSSWGIADDTLPQQQSNLRSNLRRRWESGTLPVGLKGTPRTGFPGRHRHVPKATSRMENRDRTAWDFLCVRRSSEGLKASGGSSSPTQFPVAPSLDPPPNCRPLPMTFSGIGDSSPPGAALTLNSLNSSTLVDGHSSPAGLQALARPSASSADQHRSLQGLKKEATSMEANASFPREPQSSSRVPRPPCEPQISTLAVQKVLEASVEGCLDEELPSGAFCGSEVYLKDLPLDVFSLKGLESPLEMLRAESSLNKALSMADTQEEEPPTVHPSGDPEDKHGEAGGAPITTSSFDEVSVFTALQKVNPFGEAIRKGPRRCFRPADNTGEPDTNLTRRRENGSLAGHSYRSQVPSAGKTNDGVEPPSCQERKDRTALMKGVS